MGDKKKLELPEKTKDLLLDIINPPENMRVPRPGDYWKIKSPDKSKEMFVCFEGFSEYLNTKTGEWTTDNHFTVKVVDKKNNVKKK